MQSLNYFPLISRPTRFPELNQRGKPSLLDNIYTNCLPNVISGILKFKISDHLPIFILASNFNNDQAKIKIKFRDYSIHNKNMFRSELAKLTWTDEFTDPDVNINTNKFLGIVKSLYSKCFPLMTKMITQKSLKCPWITKGIIKSSKKKFIL